MEKTKQFVIYYNEKSNLIGFRERHFNWDEGEDITTNGVKTTIFGVFDATEKNMELVHIMFATLRKYEPHRRTIVAYAGVHNTNELVNSIHDGSFFSMKPVAKTYCTNKHVWKDFDAKLDYVDDVMAQMD